MGSGVCGCVSPQHQTGLSGARSAQGVAGYMDLQIPNIIQGSEQEALIEAVGEIFLLNGRLDDGMQVDITALLPSQCPLPPVVEVFSHPGPEHAEI